MDVSGSSCSSVSTGYGSFPRRTPDYNNVDDYDSSRASKSEAYYSVTPKTESRPLQRHLSSNSANRAKLSTSLQKRLNSALSEAAIDSFFVKSPIACDSNSIGTAASTTQLLAQNIVSTVQKLTLRKTLRGRQQLEK